MADMILEKGNQEEYSKTNNPKKILVRLAKNFGRITTVKRTIIKLDKNYHSPTNNPYITGICIANSQNHS